MNYAHTLVRHLSQACKALGTESSFLLRFFGLLLLPSLTSEHAEFPLSSLLVLLEIGDGFGRPRGIETMDIWAPRDWVTKRISSVCLSSA